LRPAEKKKRAGKDALKVHQQPFIKIAKQRSLSNSILPDRNPGGTFCSSAAASSREMIGNVQQIPDTAARGFVMFNRAPEVAELLKDPLAFALLAQIAQRARWRTTFSSDGVQLGEALIGDHKSLGMTRAEYRTRIARLERWRQIAIRTTNKGTIAKLISSVVFNINSETTAAENNQQDRQQTTSQQPTDSQQITNGSPLTKKERTKEGENEKKRKNAHPSDDTSNDEYTSASADVSSVNVKKRREPFETVMARFKEAHEKTLAR
jgi:hypothetical protein